MQPKPASECARLQALRIYQIREFFKVSTPCKCWIALTQVCRRNWYPQGIKLLEGKGHKKSGEEVMKHHLGDKTIADVCEALIGAALLSDNSPGDMTNKDMAVKAVTKLVSSEDHNVTKWADYYRLYTKPKYQVAQATASQLDLAMQVEKVHDYHFKYPRLLRSAFIHPSYTFVAEKVPCYQRLEFLGDSLLDMVSVNFLFHRHPDKDPQWLTEHKVCLPISPHTKDTNNLLTFRRWQWCLTSS